MLLLVLTTLATPGLGYQCMSGFSVVERSCLRLVDLESPRPFHAASIACRELGAEQGASTDLASLPTLERMIAVGEFLSKAGRKDAEVWVGLHRDERQQYFWSIEPAMQPTNENWMWQEGEPSAGDDKRCAVLRAGDFTVNALRMSSCDDSAKLQYALCEFRPRFHGLSHNAV